MLTYRMARDSMNIRAAFLHNLADALSSIGVIIAGALILLYDFTLIDPILTLVIAGYVLWHGGVEIRGAVHILMNGTPEGMTPGEVAAAVRGVPGVADIHHLHLWRLSERSVSLEAHVVLAGEAVDPGEVKRRIRATMAERFGVHHVTLETERPGEVCDDRGAVAV